MRDNTCLCVNKYLWVYLMDIIDTFFYSRLVNLKLLLLQNHWQHLTPSGRFSTKCNHVITVKLSKVSLKLFFSLATNSSSVYFMIYFIA